MASRTLPHHIEAEQSVLGTIFLDPKKVMVAMDKLTPNDFFEHSHQIIYEAMLDIFNDDLQIDYASVIARLEQANTLNKAGGKEYIVSLADTVPSVAHLNTYIEYVKDHSLKREIISVAGIILEDGYTKDLTANEYLDQAEEAIFNLVQKRKSEEFATFPEVLKEVREKVEFNQKNKADVTGLKTGFSNLNEVTSGFQPEELIILAARPSMGKSAFAMNLAMNVALRNKEGKAGVAIFSLEMSNEQLVSRMLSSESNIDNMAIRQGKISTKDWLKFEASIRNLQRYNIFFDDSAVVTISDIRAKCRKLSQEGKLDFVIIDYLQLIKGDNDRVNRQEEVARISRGLKQMARELKVPVLALSQLSRRVEEEKDKRPMLSHLRESGSIEQDADIVMFLYRDDYYKRDEETHTGLVELSIAKNRQGIAGRTLQYIFEPQHSRFKMYTEREE